MLVLLALSAAFDIADPQIAYGCGYFGQQSGVLAQTKQM